MRSTTVAVVVAVFVGFGIWGIFAWRTSISAKNQSTLCGVIYHIIQTSDASLGMPGTPGAVYYDHHPAELHAAHKANKNTLGELPCQP